MFDEITHTSDMFDEINHTRDVINHSLRKTELHA